MFEMFKNWKRQELDKLGTSKPNKKKNGKKNNNPEKSKIIRKLKHKTRYLEIEYEEAQELLAHAKLKFHQAIAKYCQNHKNANNPLGPIKQEEPQSKEQRAAAEEEVKAIYREIALATHPDKNPEADKEVHEIFTKASQAKKENKIEDLINISFDLNIDLSEISIELIEEIEKSLQEKEKKIKEMLNDLAVNWFRAPKDVQRNLIKSICPIKKDKK